MSLPVVLLWQTMEAEPSGEAGASVPTRSTRSKQKKEKVDKPREPIFTKVGTNSCDTEG